MRCPSSVGLLNDLLREFKAFLGIYMWTEKCIPPPPAVQRKVGGFKERVLSNTGGNVFCYREGLLGSWPVGPSSLGRLLILMAQTVLCWEEEGL